MLIGKPTNVKKSPSIDDIKDNRIKELLSFKKVDTNNNIQKSQTGMVAPPTSYVTTPAFANKDDVKLDQVTIPWKDALDKLTAPPKTTPELFDPEVKQLYGMKDKVVKYAKRFLESGYTPEQTAGILGSIYQESKFNPQMKQHKGKGFGLAQWTTGDVRYHQLVDLARQKGLPITNEDVQLEHLMNELNAKTLQHQRNAWGGVGRRESFISNSDTIPKATSNFTDLFLRAGRANMKRRNDYASHVLTIMKDYKLFGEEPQVVEKHQQGAKIKDYVAPTESIQKTPIDHYKQREIKTDRNAWYRFMDENPKTNLAYDAVNFGLYAAAPFTGGATLPFATAMTLAQGAAGVSDIIDHGARVDNVIDTAGLIPGLGLTKALGKQTTKAATKAALKATTEAATPIIIKKGENQLGKQFSKSYAEYRAKKAAADMKAINIATKTSLFSSNLGLDFLQFKNDLGK